jgi:hypothetical protein
MSMAVEADRHVSPDGVAGFWSVDSNDGKMAFLLKLDGSHGYFGCSRAAPSMRTVSAFM